MSCGASTDTPPSRGLSDILRQVEAIFPSSLEQFHVSGPLHSIDVQTWGRVLAAFPQLQSLCLHSALADMMNISSALKPAAEVVPCPNLCCLFLELDGKGDTSEVVLDELHDALRERSEANARLQLLRIAERESGTGGANAADSEDRPEEKLGAVVDRMDWIVRAVHTYYDSAILT